MASRAPLRAGVVLLAALACAQASSADEPAASPERARAAAEAGRHEEARDLWRVLLDAAAARGERDAAALAPLHRGLAAALLALGEDYAALEPLERAARGGAAEDRLRYAARLLSSARANAAQSGATAGQVMPYLDDALGALGDLTDPEAQRLRGEAHYQAGRLAEAVSAWGHLPVGDAPDEQERWYRERLAHALYLLGRHAEAAGVYEDLGQRRGAAASWAAAREGEKALAHLLALLEEAPGDGALLEEALAAARFTGLERRLEERLGALPAPTEQARAAYVAARARLLLLLGEAPTAAARLREALAAASGAPRADLGAALARTLLLTPGLDEEGRDEAARVLLEGWAAHRGDARLSELMLTVAQQDFAGAPSAWPDPRPLERSIALQQALSEAAPEDPVLLTNLGNTLRLAGRGAQAVATLERATAAAPGDAALTNDLGLARLAAGDRDGAARSFRQALEELPGFAAARQNLARLELLGGRPAQARDLLAGAEGATRRIGEPWVLYRYLALRAWRAAPYK